MSLDLEQVPRCMICGAEGLWLHRDLRDTRYGMPGQYHLRRCPHCSLVWLDPRPEPASISLFYREYYTHVPEPTGSDGSERRRLGHLRDSLRAAILCGHFGYRIDHRSHVSCRLGALMARVRFLRHRAVFDDLMERFPRFREPAGQSAHRCGVRPWRLPGTDEVPGLERSRDRTGLCLVGNRPVTWRRHVQRHPRRGPPRRQHGRRDRHEPRIRACPRPPRAVAGMLPRVATGRTARVVSAQRRQPGAPIVRATLGWSRPPQAPLSFFPPEYRWAAAAEPLPTL